MQEIYVENLPLILINKNKLEKELKIKISNKGKNIFIEGKPEDEYLALKILEAMNLDFSIERALLLKNENNLLHIINIKEKTKRNDLHHIKSRLIGTRGKTLKTLNQLSECAISLHDNKI